MRKLERLGVKFVSLWLAANCLIDAINKIYLAVYLRPWRDFFLLSEQNSAYNQYSSKKHTGKNVNIYLLLSTYSTERSLKEERSMSLLLSKLKPTAVLTEGRLVLFMCLTQTQWYSWISICCTMFITLPSLISHQTAFKDYVTGKQRLLEKHPSKLQGIYQLGIDMKK